MFGIFLSIMTCFWELDISLEPCFDFLCAFQNHVYLCYSVLSFGVIFGIAHIFEILLRIIVCFLEFGISLGSSFILGAFWNWVCLRDPASYWWYILDWIYFRASVLYYQVIFRIGYIFGILLRINGYILNQVCLRDSDSYYWKIFGNPDIFGILLHIIVVLFGIVFIFVFLLRVMGCFLELNMSSGSGFVLLNVFRIGYIFRILLCIIRCFLEL